MLLDLLDDLFLADDPDAHFAPGNFIVGLQHLDALQGLLLGGLVSLDCEVNLLHGLLDGLVSEPSLGDWVHALLHYDADYLGQSARLLGIPLLVGDLQFTPLQDHLYDFYFGFVGEELVEVRLLCHSAMRGILEDLISLQHLRHIILDPIAPVEGLVPVAGNFEVLVVDLVSDGGHIGHLYIC